MNPWLLVIWQSIRSGWLFKPCPDYMFGAPFAQLSYRLFPSSEPVDEGMNLFRNLLFTVEARIVARQN